MEETVLFPSPNWFRPSVIGVSEDDWLVYGGPSKTLVVLEPLPLDFNGVIDSKHRYKAHVFHRSNRERVVAVDISPEWPKKRHFVSGSADGAIKEWAITQLDNKYSIKCINSHEIHASEKEEIIGVGYSMATHIVSVGNFSNVTVWELNTNMTKPYNFMRHFKATCMSCSPHSALVVAVGTKQGVVFVLDLNGKGNIVYKVRGQDEEIGQVTWCPQYEVTLKKSLQEKKSLATQRMEQIRNEPEPSDLNASAASKNLPEDSFDQSAVVEEDDMFDIYKDHEANEFGHKKYEPEDILVKTKVVDEKDDFLAECERLKAQILKNKQEEEESIETLVEAMDKASVEPARSKSPEVETKGLAGVASLGTASSSTLLEVEGTDHVHRHLLASISKNGISIRIWSKTGKIVATCSVAVNTKFNQSHKSHVNKSPHGASLHWYKADSLLIVDGKTHLLECNPLNLDRNRLHWRVVPTPHRRGVYCVASGAARVQPAPAGDGEHWPVWTAAQDRYLVKYDMRTRQPVATFGTCGGFLYDIKACPYDASKVSIGVGDGAVRVWESQSAGEDEARLAPGELACYWQNVQGKILQCAWHPTCENLLAFSTAEARVGILDTSKGERAAKVLQPALSHGVYSLAWGAGMTLFAVGGRELVMYQANKPDQAPIPIEIEIEGQKWEPSVVGHSARGLAVGSHAGGVAVFRAPAGHALAAKFVFTRTIHGVEWHPQQTSSSDEESKYKDYVAISAIDKTNVIVILHYEDKEGGGKQFTSVNTLAGHSDRVLQVYWSPHRDGQLLSTSADTTVRVWDAMSGVCTSVFAGHSAGTLGAAWCARPQLAGRVLSGAADFCLRLWDVNDFPAQDYKEVKKEKEVKKRKKNKNKEASVRVGDDDGRDSDDENETDNVEQEINDKEKYTDTKEVEKCKGVNNKETEQSDEEVPVEYPKWMKAKDGKRFILPLMAKQFSKLNVQGIRVMLQRYLQKHKEIKNILEIAKAENPELYDVDFLKLFGNINEVNEVLDMECASHLQLKAYKEYVMLMIFRGRIDSVIQFANENDLLDPFLLSIAPCVSFKYWKDVTQLYVAQIDRLAVKKNEDWPYKELLRCAVGSKEYLAVYRKAAALLSVHDVRGAVLVLENAKLFKEAYILCRCRHMDSIAGETLNKWLVNAIHSGELVLAALINIVMGKVTDAATVLRRSNNQDDLNLAAELAKSAGLNTFADYIETKVKSVENDATPEQKTEELLDTLPTKMELLMREQKNQFGDQDVTENLETKSGLSKCVETQLKGETESKDDQQTNQSELVAKELVAKENNGQNGGSETVNVIANGNRNSCDAKTVTDSSKE